MLIQKTLITLIVSVLAHTAFAADVAIPTSTDTEVKQERVENTLATDISRDLRSDPLYQGIQVRVDLYNGLAVVHGSATNRSMVQVVTDKLRRTKGIDVVYNYMSNSEEPLAAQSMAVSYDYFDHINRVGIGGNSFSIAQRVQDRLAADAPLTRYNFDVDSYMGLIILHGVVNDSALAKRAKEVAAHTDGVDAVLSYIDVSGQPSMFAAIEAPIFVRPAPVEALSVSTPVNGGATNCSGCQPCSNCR